MKNNNLVFWVLISACLAAGFISGWTIKDYVSGNGRFVNMSGGVIRVHDTIKTAMVEYRVIPGREYNIDSIVEALNQSWRDSLKEMYGKGLFEARFSQESNIGKREITLESRIPVDPEAVVTVDEELKLPEVYPKGGFGIIAGLGYDTNAGLSGAFGIRYNILESKYFSLWGAGKGIYLFRNREWLPAINIEAELRL